MSAASLVEYLGVPGSPVRLRVHGPPPPLLDALRAAAPWLELEPGSRDAPPELELVGARPHGRMRVLGHLEGRLGEPVAEALRALATSDLDFDGPATPAALAELGRPVELVVVVTPSCPFCPRVASMALRFAAASPRVATTIVRADDPRAPRRVASVPSALVEGRVVASGAVGEHELARAIVEAAGA